MVVMRKIVALCTKVLFKLQLLILNWSLSRSRSYFAIAKGAWSSEWPSNMTSSVCNIARHADLSEDVFYSQYYMKRPVILEKASRNSPKKWVKKRFLSTFGKHPLGVGTIRGITMGGNVGSVMSLRKYVKRMGGTSPGQYLNASQPYVFDRDIFSTSPELSRKYFCHPFFCTGYHNVILVLGGTSTGASFHRHGNSWLEVPCAQSNSSVLTMYLHCCCISCWWVESTGSCFLSAMETHPLIPSSPQLIGSGMSTQSFPPSEGLLSALLRYALPTIHKCKMTL